MVVIGNKVEVVYAKISYLNSCYSFKILEIPSAFRDNPCFHKFSLPLFLPRKFDFSYSKQLFEWILIIIDWSLPYYSIVVSHFFKSVLNGVHEAIDFSYSFTSRIKFPGHFCMLILPGWMILTIHHPFIILKEPSKARFSTKMNFENYIEENILSFSKKEKELPICMYENSANAKKFYNSTSSKKCEKSVRSKKSAKFKNITTSKYSEYSLRSEKSESSANCEHSASSENCESSVNSVNSTNFIKSENFASPENCVKSVISVNSDNCENSKKYVKYETSVNSKNFAKSVYSVNSDNFENYENSTN